MTYPLFATARRQFHADLLAQVLFIDDKGVPSNADSNSQTSRKIASGVAERLKVETGGTRLAGQQAGKKFEEICADFLERTFMELNHLRPGKWVIRGGGKGGELKISNFQQYCHLLELQQLIEEHPAVRSALGSDYIITPDIVIVRNPESDASINRKSALVDTSISKMADLREEFGALPTLHASISCKWTIRSDRAQNARSEGLNLVRNRKGRLPHIAVVTGEPLPTRISSVAIGTGDIDCVYHFALEELFATIAELGFHEQKDSLDVMIQGKRLKDISDLPLDLAV